MYLPSYLELFTVDLLHDRVSLGTFPCFILDIMVALKCRSMKSRSKFHVQVEEKACYGLTAAVGHQIVRSFV